MKIYSIVGIVLVLMNLVGYVMMWNDKNRARNHRWRISERTLILCAILGGSIGSLAGMKRFHHKTKHPKFYIGIPVILVLQIGAVVAYIQFH